MSGAIVWVLAFLSVALVALVLGWYAARKMKTDLDSDLGAVAGSRVSLDLTPASAVQLRELSVEPILLKQSEEGVRVQIEHRPMLPLMAFVGKDVSAALAEAAGRVSEQWGPKWVALVTARDDGSVSAQRLA